LSGFGSIPSIISIPDDLIYKPTKRTKVRIIKIWYGLKYSVTKLTISLMASALQGNLPANIFCILGWAHFPTASNI